MAHRHYAVMKTHLCFLMIRLCLQGKTLGEMDRLKLLIHNLDLSYRLEWVGQRKVKLSQHSHELGTFQLWASVWIGKSLWSSCSLLNWKKVQIRLIWFCPKGPTQNRPWCKSQSWLPFPLSCLNYYPLVSQKFPLFCFFVVRANETLISIVTGCTIVILLH